MYSLGRDYLFVFSKEKYQIIFNTAATHIIFLAVFLLLANHTFANERNNTIDNTIAVEEVIVTARKREENLQNVPSSIYQYSPTQLTKNGVMDFSDIAASTPGISMAKTGVGGSRYFIRGTGQVTVNQAPTTGIYLNDLPLQIRTSFGVAQVDPRLFDIQAVEVLRGPQGTLFGGSAMGGAIRINTMQPDLNSSQQKLGFTTSETKDGGINTTLEAVMNLPVSTDRSAVRIAIQKDDQAGFIDDIRPITNDIYSNRNGTVEDVNDIQNDSLRMGYKTLINNDFSLTASLFYQDQHANQARPWSDLTLSDRTVARYMDTSTDDKTTIFNLKTDWDLKILSGASLVSITGYQDRQVDGSFDLSPFSNGGIELSAPKPAPFEDYRYVVGLFNNVDIEQFSQELRITSPSDSSFQYLGGLFYKDVKQINKDDRNIVDTFNTGVDPIIRESSSEFNEQEIAIFGEGSYRLSDTVTMSLGGRLFNFDQEESRLQYGVGGQARGSEDFNFSDSTDESGFSPRATVSYQPIDEFNVYISYAEGFRSGGINAPIVDDVCSPQARSEFGIPSVPAPYDSDTNKTTELGAKYLAFGGHFSLNATVYQTRWTDYQLSVQQDCGPSSGVARFTANAGNVDIEGFELELSVSFNQHLRFKAGYGYTDAVFVGSTDPALQTRGITPGTELFDIPENTWNIQLEYSHPIMQTLEGYAFISSHFVDESLTGFGEGEAPVRPDYTLTNMRMGLSAEQWDISLFANNLTDETAIYGIEFTTSSGNTTATDEFGALINQPRTVGISLNINF